MRLFKNLHEIPGKDSDYLPSTEMGLHIQLSSLSLFLIRPPVFSFTYCLQKYFIFILLVLLTLKANNYASMLIFTSGRNFKDVPGAFPVVVQKTGYSGCSFR